LNQGIRSVKIGRALDNLKEPVGVRRAEQLPDVGYVIALISWCSYVLYLTVNASISG
jgi:hypothetical protein